jgi:hypothetical protein
MRRRDDEAARMRHDWLNQIRFHSPELVHASGSSSVINEKRYDAFISHASEDKDTLVRPLAEKLRALDFRIWYDEFELKVGDSLRRSIDKGLANSKLVS